METFYLNIAGLTFRINLHPAQYQYYRNKLIGEIKNIYKGFISYGSKKSDLVIDFYEGKHIFYTRRTKNKAQNFIYFYESKSKNRIITFYSISLHQFIMILTDYLHKTLVSQKAFFLHASASLDRKNAILFCGPSGAGKSTAAALLNPEYNILADDVLIVRKIRNEFYACQSPAIEKNLIPKDRKGYKIGKVFFLHKAKEFRAEKAEDKNIVINNLSQQLWADKKYLAGYMKILWEFIHKFDGFYNLYFANDSKKLIKMIRGFSG